jgi:hypothetical protein
MHSRYTTPLRTAPSVVLALLVLAVGNVCGISTAAAQVAVDEPLRVLTVQETNSSNEILEYAGGNDTGLPPTKHRIVLGDPPYRSALGPTFAEVFSSFENGVSSYYAAINAYPGRPNDNGDGLAVIDWNYRVLMDRSDATFILSITGGRLQLVDYLFNESLTAKFSLSAVAYGTQGIFSVLDASASLDGHGGQPSSATFFPDWEGLQIASGNYSEQVDFNNVVGATLEIPAQDLQLDLRNVFVGSEFLIHVLLTMEVRATYLDGTAAMAFLRDPTHLNDSDPLLGSPSVTFSGLTLLTPVPEPSPWGLLAVGLASLAVLVRRRSGKVVPV